MNRSTFPATLLAVATMQACAATPPPSNTNSEPTTAATVPGERDMLRQGFDAAHVTHVSHVTEVPVEQEAPKIEGHPLTSVVVTQCNLIVAVYMTMSDGRLLRFDKSAAVPTDQLMTMAYSATRSERVEVSCNDTGAAGFEKHDPV